MNYALRFENYFVTLHPLTSKSDAASRAVARYSFLGLTGFDGKMRWYVSTRSWAMGGSLISSVEKLIGNNEYALAA